MRWLRSLNGTGGTLRRVAGAGGALSIVFALLAGCCTFLAVAGPREDLSARTQALRQTLLKLPPLTTTVAGAANWSDFTSLIYQNPTVQPTLTPDLMRESIAQLRRVLRADSIPLQPAVRDWAAATSRFTLITSAMPTTAEPGGLPPKIEISYRTSLPGFGRLVSGRYPGQPGANTLEVVLTQATAERFGLRVGSKIQMSGGIQLLVTGMIAPVATSTAYWADDPTFELPQLIRTQHAIWWDAGVLTNDANYQQFQLLLLNNPIALTWGLPIDVSKVNADQAPALKTDLDLAATQTPPMTGELAPAASTVALTDGVAGVLDSFIQTETAAQDLSWLLFVSLTTTAAVVLLLTAGLIAARRHTELVVLRARGASARQVAMRMFAGTLLCCLPVIAAATAAALAATRGADNTPVVAWVLAGTVLLVSLAGPAVLGVRSTASSVARPRNMARNVTAGRPRRRARSAGRLVTELTVVASAVAGLVIYRQHPASVSGVNPLGSAAPVLVAVPVVVVTGRIWPLLIRLTSALTRRRAGAPVLIALARAARSATLTTFAVVLALTLAAFGGMVRDAITRGQVAASWQTAGADESVDAQAAGGFSPAARAAFASLPGAQHEIAVSLSLWTLGNGQQLTVIGVDPASYAAFTASSPGFPVFNPSELSGAGSVIASPSVARQIGSGGMAAYPGVHGRVLTFSVKGSLGETPALPGNPYWVIANLATASQAASGLAPNVMLVNGTVDVRALAAAVRKWVPGATISSRSTALDALTSAPVQHATYLTFLLAILAAAALAIVAVACEAARGADERELTLARLAAMGLTGGQRARLIATELVPGVIAAALAAGVSALALPRLLAGGLDLSVFTGSGASVAIGPDVTAFAVPVVALVALAAGATALGARPRRSFAEQLRIGG